MANTKNGVRHESVRVARPAPTTVPMATPMALAERWIEKTRGRTAGG